MINYNSPNDIRAFLDSNGMGMRKKFGQNFLIDPAIRSRLLDALDVKKGDEVWEVGAGLGAMTAMLLERNVNVTAFEIDPFFIRMLKEFFGTEGAFRLIEGDILKTWRSVYTGEENFFLFGNLPYNIAALLLADFIEEKRFFKRMVVTVQREVARRMTALPGSKDYSSFTVLCTSVYKISPLQVIKGASFYPAPRVESQGVCLNLLSPKSEPPMLFYPMVRSLFSSRRKSIRNTLFKFACQVIINRNSSCIKEIIAEVLQKTGIKGERRPETLEINEFKTLAVLLENYTKGKSV